jgi:hypothetical protein
VQVQVEDIDEMNLLGLFMKAALEDRVHAVESAGLNGDIALSAGEMSVTMSFSPERVVIRKGMVERPRARLKGSLEDVIALGRGKIASRVLTGRVRVSGNPAATLPLAKVFRS